MRKIKIRLALWCYRRGWVRLACKISPSIGWYVIGADFAKTFNTVMSAISALGEGYYDGKFKGGKRQWAVGQSDSQLSVLTTTPEAISETKD